jgi:hypothetical protein
VAKFSSRIVWVLSCFDRVIFKGHLPIRRPREFENFGDYRLQMRRCDFLKTTAPQWSERIVAYAKDYARQPGRLFDYRQGAVDKEAGAKEQIQQQGLREGLVGIWAVQEACPTFKLVPGEGRPGFQARSVPQRVWYWYFRDKALGLLHVRLQTGAPFTCPVYVNGHDLVAQQLTPQGLGFVQQENAVVQLDNPEATQRIAERFAKLPWPRLLERYARLLNPLLQDVLHDLTHYGVTDQAEYATDRLFTGKQALAGRFARLVEYAWLTCSPKRVLGFLGRKGHRRFDGEVQTYCKTEREPGACIKHTMKGNRLKLYDTFGLLLRVETLIKQPGECPVYRECQHHDGSPSKGWLGRCKGVGNLHPYPGHAVACNRRYLEARAAVEEPTPGYEDLRAVTEPRCHHGRSYAGFNPARAAEARRFAAVLAGDHLAQGFRNQDIRVSVSGPARTPRQRQRHRAAVGRRRKRLPVRGWLAKVPHRRRWRVTARGRRILGDMLFTYRRYPTQVA